jgi:Chaperone of endosialidase
MNSINYKNLPTYMGTSNYILNIVNLNNTISNASGLSDTAGLITAVSNIQKIVDYSKKQINVNAISNYDKSPIQVLAPLNLSNVNLYQNGNIFIGGGGGGGASLSSGNTALLINGTSSPTSIAFNFLAANSTIMTLNQQGTLALPYGASPNKYLECIDISGNTQWNYVSNLTNGVGSLNVLGNNNFSFQENSVEIASLTSNGNMTAQNFFSVSDKRFKTNISTITNAGEILKQIRGVRFDWLKDGTPDIGVIAQEVFDVVPEAIVSTNTNMLTVAYNKIIPLLIETIKDLQKRVETLEAKCAT